MNTRIIGNIVHCEVKKPHFPYCVILWIFRAITRSKEVAMVDPFCLEVVSIGDTWIPLKMFKHEQRHIQQVVKEGRFKFVLKYLWYNIKFGYRNNPYELDAVDYSNR